MASTAPLGFPQLLPGKALRREWFVDSAHLINHSPLRHLIHMSTFYASVRPKRRYDTQKRDLGPFALAGMERGSFRLRDRAGDERSSAKQKGPIALNHTISQDYTNGRQLHIGRLCALDGGRKRAHEDDDGDAAEKGNNKRGSRLAPAVRQLLTSNTYGHRGVGLIIKSQDHTRCDECLKIFRSWDDFANHLRESSTCAGVGLDYDFTASLYRLTRENSEGGRNGIEQADSSKDSYQQSVNLFEKYPSIYKRPNTANKPNTPPRPTLDPPQQSARLRDYLDRRGVPMFGAGNTSLKSTRVGPSLPGLRPTVDLGIFNHRPSHTAKLSYPAVHHDALTYCRSAVAVFSAQARRRLAAPG